jgi:hypothetical protein
MFYYFVCVVPEGVAEGDTHCGLDPEADEEGLSVPAGCGTGKL